MLLHEAVAADPFFGPAHNNLGVLRLKNGALYDAANEFEAARKLMPGHPDPRVNLGLTLERAGRIEEAIEAYLTALEVTPDYVPALQGVARLQIRSGRSDDRTARYLSVIAERADAPAWREWANSQLIKLDPANAQSSADSEVRP